MEWVECYKQLPVNQEIVWGWTGSEVMKGIPFIINAQEGIVLLALEDDKWVYIFHWMKIDPPVIEMDVREEIFQEKNIRPTKMTSKEKSKKKQKK